MGENVIDATLPRCLLRSNGPQWSILGYHHTTILLHDFNKIVIEFLKASDG